MFSFFILFLFPLFSKRSVSSLRPFPSSSSPRGKGCSRLAQGNARSGAEDVAAASPATTEAPLFACRHRRHRRFHCSVDARLGPAHAARRRRPRGLRRRRLRGDDTQGLIDQSSSSNNSSSRLRRVRCAAFDALCFAIDLLLGAATSSSSSSSSSSAAGSPPCSFSPTDPAPFLRAPELRSLQGRRQSRRRQR